MTSPFPIASVGSADTSDSLTAASPAYQNLLSQVGGPSGTQNLDSLAASNPQLASLFSLMNPGGGINQSQASQFGPMFSLLLSLQQGQGGQ